MLAGEWRDALFPDADDAEFADAYAQTITYALLLARFDGANDMTPDTAAQMLDAEHGVLGQALRVLAQPDARDEIGIGLDLLLRVLNAVDLTPFQKDDGDAEEL